MFANAQLISFVALAALGVYAQSGSSSASAPTTTSGISQCVLSCSEQAAAQGGCASFADLQCVCTNAAFQEDANACLKANCTAADMTAALALQSQECASISGAITTPLPTSTSGSAVGSSSSSSVASSPSSSGSSASHSSSPSVGSSSAPASGSSSAGGSSSSAPAPGSSGASSSSPAPSPSNTGNSASPLALSGAAAAFAAVLAGAGLVL